MRRFATMGSVQLIVFGLVLTCVWLSEARFLSISVPTYWGVEAQRPAEVEVEPAAAPPERGHSRQSAQQASRPLLAVEPFSWKYPQHPVDPVTKPPVQFGRQQLQKQQPATAHSMAVRCGESRVQVEVSQDLLGLSKLIKPEEMTLGGCSTTDVDPFSHVLIFESELHSCGSTMVMTENAFIYAFALVYNPKVSGRSGITRSQRATIGVECHYPR